jgi:sugar lactone lactonase YvrE
VTGSASVSVTPAATTTYTLTAANAAGTTATSTATVTVSAHNQLTLLAGNVGSQGSAATFDYPAGSAVDASGNVYVADAGNNTIEKITPAGAVTTLAGSGIIGSADGTGTAATFSKPTGIAVDASGNLYVTDTNNDTIRKITPGGGVTTFAGSAGVEGTSDGTGSAARFNYPIGIAVDSAGNLFVTQDATNGKPIRKITPGGVVTTPVSTNGGCYLYTMEGIAVDAGDNLYVVNGYQICRITPAGVSAVLAGGYYNGSADGTGSTAQFNNPIGITVDYYGNLFVADTGNDTVRKVTSAGVVTTFVGSAGSQGSTDGTGSAARFTQPMGIAVDANGNLYVNDNGNKTVRKISSAGIVTTLAGSPGSQGSTNGTGPVARFSNPTGAAIDANGNLYVADTLNSTIRKITPAGVVTTLAGWAGTLGSANGTGSSATFKYPTGTAVDVYGNTYVADTGNRTIREITPVGVVTTLSTTTVVNGNSYQFYFNRPVGIAVDASGNIYATDASNCSIYKITQSGTVTVLAGGLQGGSANGTGSAAGFNDPTGIALDTNGNLYVTDSKNATIRKITSAGVVTTLAGVAGHKGNADGTGSAASFSYPVGITLDSSGNLYVTDFGNDSVRKITPSGVVTTIPVNAGAGTSSISLDAPVGIAVDSSGKLYITDDNGVLTLVP